jgi:hypothetical protein
MISRKRHEAVILSILPNSRFGSDTQAAAFYAF